MSIRPAQALVWILLAVSVVACVAVAVGLRAGAKLILPVSERDPAGGEKRFDALWGRHDRAFGAYERRDGAGRLVEQGIVAGGRGVIDELGGSGPSSTQTYRDGVVDGTLCRYDDHGALVWAQQFKHGVAEGLSMEFADGALVAVGSWAADREDGRWTGYYPDGRLRFIGRYRHGEQIGIWTEYGEDGTATTTTFPP